MTASSLSRNHAMSDLAERQIAEVNASRQRLEESRTALNRHRTDELAETEALALARIKSETERALAHQALMLRDAERAAELVAIERRTADLDATKAAQRRLALEQEATAIATARAAAEALAQHSLHEQKAALAAAKQARIERLQAELAARNARRDGKLARLGLLWMKLQTAPPLLVGIVALALGFALNALGGSPLAAQKSAPQATQTSALRPIVSDISLRLDNRLSAAPLARSQ